MKFNESNDYEQIFNFNKLDDNGELTSYWKVKSGGGAEMNSHDILVLSRLGFNCDKAKRDGKRNYSECQAVKCCCGGNYHPQCDPNKINDKYKTITVWKWADEWFSVEVIGGDWNPKNHLNTQFTHRYICDQIDGVVKLLKDKEFI
jgi:hypothetical protein